MQFHGSGGEGQRHPPPPALAEPEPPLPRKLWLTKPHGEDFIARCSWMGLTTVTAAARCKGTPGSPWRGGSSLPS